MNIVRTLRDPGGCPWDREQTHSSLRQYLLEETYEALEAIESGDPHKLAEEMGDLLTHIAFHIDMAGRAAEFTEERFFSELIEKLLRRHPHVFGDGPKLSTAEDVVGQWEALKRQETGRGPAVEGIPSTMPALAYAAALQRRAAKSGLTWEGEPEFQPRKGDGSAALERKAGAYLWAAVKRLRDAGVDPETALRAVSLEFRDRVRRAEKGAQGKAQAAGTN
jgi:MazG family protein